MFAALTLKVTQRLNPSCGVSRRSVASRKPTHTKSDEVLGVRNFRHTMAYLDFNRYGKILISICFNSHNTHFSIAFKTRISDWSSNSDSLSAAYTRALSSTVYYCHRFELTQLFMSMDTSFHLRPASFLSSLDPSWKVLSTLSKFDRRLI